MTHYLINSNIPTLSDDELQHYLLRISTQRKEKIMRMKHPAVRSQSLHAYMLLQRLLREVYGITEPPVFRELENGKPVLVGHEAIHFNMSHCKEAVACVVSHHPVGIDVESIREKYDSSLSRYVFSEQEVEKIEKSPNPQLAFTRLWTMKEATVKLSGQGITGKEQLRPLLNDWYEGRAKYNFTIEEHPEDHFICTLCE